MSGSLFPITPTWNMRRSCGFAFALCSLARLCSPPRRFLRCRATDSNRQHPPNPTAKNTARRHHRKRRSTMHPICSCLAIDLARDLSCWSIDSGPMSRSLAFRESPTNFHMGGEKLLNARIIIRVMRRDRRWTAAAAAVAAGAPTHTLAKAQHKDVGGGDHNALLARSIRGKGSGLLGVSCGINHQMDRGDLPERPSCDD